METTLITLPIARVTVLEDRAQVERQGSVSLAKGLQRLRLESISPVAVDRSLKVELGGATLCDAAVVRRWKEKPKGGLPADASALRRTLEALDQELIGLGHELARRQVRRELLQTAQSDLMREVRQATGAGHADAADWHGRLTQVRQQVADNEEALRTLAVQQQRAQRKREEAHRAWKRSEQPDEEFQCAVELSVEAGAEGTAALKVSYLVPSAVWRPAYRATLDRNSEGQENVKLESEAVVWQRTREDWKDVELCLSTARPTLGASPPTLLDDQLDLRDKSARERKVVEVSLREETIQSTGESSGGMAREMPGLDDGGEVQVLSSPVRVTIPSDGNPHRVHLSTFESPARTELTCAPEHSPLAYSLTRFPNRGGHVLLAGPVDLVRQSGFMGRAQMRFAAVGETVRLTFGSEDHLRVTRTQDESHDEAMLSGRRTTKRTVRLYLSNASGTPSRLALEERIPVSEVKEVEITVLPKECKPPAPAPSKDGVLRYEVSLPGRSQKDITLVYEISAAGKVAGL